ncbi:MAG: alpha/beta hydrolase [Chloroflexota bacterium]
MNPKMVMAGGQRIATYDSGGEGTAVFFLHGNSASSLTFKAQLEGDFGKKYRAVAMDLPGHGESEKAADPENTYHMPGYAAVLADVAQQLGVEDGVFVGWSLGGHIVLEAHQLLSKAAGFAIFGTPPLAYPPDMENGFLPNPNMAAAFADALTPEQMKGFAEACLAPNSSLDLAPFVADIARTDGLARATMGGSIAPGNYADEVEIVKRLKRPLAILQGEHEQLVNPNYFGMIEIPTLWRGSIQTIQDAGHTPQVENAAAFSKVIADFVDDVA